jgi:hypothetical protein
MNKNILHSLLKKYADGDVSVVDSVIPKLADRLVVLPTVTTSTNQENGQIKVSVVTLKESNRSVIPVFTTMALLKDWLAKMEINGEGLSMSGVDVALSLGTHRWLMVDPGTDYWCEFEPDIVRQIAEFEVEDDWDFDEPVIDKQTNNSFQQKPTSFDTSINKTQEVPILLNPLTTQKNLNPSNQVQSFAPIKTNRLRTNDDANERKATMDLTNLRKKLT